MEKLIKQIAKELKLIRRELQKRNRDKVTNIVYEGTKELVASISEDDVILKNGYTVIETEE